MPEAPEAYTVGLLRSSMTSYGHRCTMGVFSEWNASSGASRGEMAGRVVKVGSGVRERCGEGHAGDGLQRSTDG